MWRAVSRPSHWKQPINEYFLQHCNTENFASYNTQKLNTSEYPIFLMYTWTVWLSWRSRLFAEVQDWSPSRSPWDEVKHKKITKLSAKFWQIFAADWWTAAKTFLKVESWVHSWFVTTAIKYKPKGRAPKTLKRKRWRETDRNRKWNKNFAIRDWTLMIFDQLDWLLLGKHRKWMIV